MGWPLVEDLVDPYPLVTKVAAKKRRRKAWKWEGAGLGESRRSGRGDLGWI